MDPISAFTVLSAGSSVAQGFGARADALNQAAQQEAQARLAETQALQRDTQSRDELTRYLSTVRAARAANGLSSVSPNALMMEREARRVMGGERIRMRADDAQRARNFRTAASAYRQRGRMSLVTGFLGAASPIADFYSVRGA